MSNLSEAKHRADRLRSLRERAGMTPSQVEERLILGPGWVEFFESEDGFSRLGVSTMLAYLQVVGATPAELFEGVIPSAPPGTFPRALFAEPIDDGLDIHFDYGRFDAIYRIPNGTLDEFELVLKTLRDGLAGLAQNVNGADPDDNIQTRAIKSAAAEQAFWAAVRAWPDANPADLWGFLVARAYVDPFNHPATFARGDHAQSWKRTGGWALEKILVTHYASYLAGMGVRVEISSPVRKAQLLADVQSHVSVRLEADKVDVLLVGSKNGSDVCFGVVHVKNSFAERRTDDVDMSRALVEAGYASPLWTMDCKSWPGPRPVHAGELGRPLPAKRSAKRIDIEDDTYFSACFSYNRNTIPTPDEPATPGKVIVCDFADADDAFSGFVVAHWEAFKSGEDRSGR